MRMRMPTRMSRLAGCAAVLLALGLAACGGGGDGAGAAAEPPVGTPAEPSAASSTEPSAQSDPPGDAKDPQGKLVFEDQFDGSTLAAHWKFRDLRVGKRACSPPDPGMTSVSGGNLNVSVALDSSKKPNVTAACPDGQYLNGMIGTQGLKSFLYGTIAARIKFPSSQGGHGSFWMQPETKAAAADAGNAAKAGVEVDIVEYFGDGRKDGGLTSFIYWPRKDGSGTVKPVTSGGLLKNVQSYFPKGETPADSFHVYSVEWTPKEYVFRIDGVQTYRIREGVSQVPQYLILSLLSSDYELPRFTKGALPLSMKVDWVRVWQK